MPNLKNSERIDKLDKLLRPLQEHYAREAWKIARELYDVNNMEERRLAFATICAVDLPVAFLLASIKGK